MTTKLPDSGNLAGIWLYLLDATALNSIPGLNPAIIPPMFVSVTRLRVRSILFIPQFLWLNKAIERQARRSQGLIGLRLLIDSRRTFWTLTAWESEKMMKAFRGASPHSRAMKKLPTWCDEAAYAHWIEEAPRLPDWPEAYQRLIQAPKLSRVLHPSEAHLRSQFREPNFNSRFRLDFTAQR